MILWWRSCDQGHVLYLKISVTHFYPNFDWASESKPLIYFFLKFQILSSSLKFGQTMKSTQIFNIVSFELPIKLDDQLDSISGNRFLQANFIIFFIGFGIFSAKWVNLLVNSRV